MTPTTDPSATTVVVGADENGEPTATVVDGEHADTSAESHAAGPEQDLNPIFPEMKEIAWGFGSFLVLLVVMRLFLYPRLRKGMDARAALIASGYTDAEQLTSAATSDVANYEQQLAAAKAEAAARIDAAREVLESERAEVIAAANARIAEQRAAAMAELEAQRAAARGDIESAVATVAAHVGKLVTGADPDPAVVAEAVAGTINAGVTR